MKIRTICKKYIFIRKYNCICISTQEVGLIQLTAISLNKFSGMYIATQTGVGEHGTIAPKSQNLEKIRIFQEATRQYLSEIRIFKQPQEIFGQNQSFGEAARTYLGKTKFFLPRKRLRFEVKIFLNYHYFGAKIEKSETDLFIEDFF